MRTLRTSVLLCSSLLLSCVIGPAEIQASAPVASAAATQGAAKAGPTKREDGNAAIRFGDAPELAYDTEFFPGARYDGAIATPDSILGQKHGTRLAHHHEVLACFRAWSENSDRVTLTSFGRTHEGRELVYAVVTSPRNHARINELRQEVAMLADPRGLSEADAERIVKNAPAVAWMAYSIHGDELSGTDASLAVAYHLIASTDADVTSMLDELVIVIDPCQNPDGRERIIGMVEQSAGYIANLDYASMHRGRWPHGRGNHYLFDMNRDWMVGSQPETRARWRAARDWHPQLFVDAHEMGSLDTFLFYPQADPKNPQLPERLSHWQSTFANEAGKSFDAQRWSYYSREWADAWAPFYSDAWGSLNGAIGILYEQARTSGFQLRRAEGGVLTYREAVHHQVAASAANLRSLQVHREAVLRDYLANARKNVAADTPGNDEWLAVRSTGNKARERELVRILDGQGIRYLRLDGQRNMTAAQGAHGEAQDSVELPAGTLAIPARQSQRQLLRAFFEFDPRIDTKTLKDEREEVERKNSSKMYDLTSWSLAHALDLDAWWGHLDGLDADKAGLTLSSQVPPGDAALAWTSFDPKASDDSTYAWVVDGEDDSAVKFAARAMEAGLVVHSSDRSFESGEHAFTRGSLMIRRGEHAQSLEELEARIHAAARATSAEPVRITSGRAPGEGPDLGGGHFHLLARPRIALVSNSPVSVEGYGHLWHQLDVVLGVPFSILDAQELDGADLRRFNVLVLPPGGLESVLEPLKDSLETWVRGGGTLVACGSSATALTSGELGLSAVTLRRDALEELDVYARAVERERAAREIEIDEELVWTGAVATPAESDAAPAAEDAEEEVEEDETPIEERDEWLRRFAPTGANLLTEIDTEHWLTTGSGALMPISCSHSAVFLSKDSVETPVRYVESTQLRLGGLLWPEARERLADSACVTRERVGNGQIILFAGQPAFRGYHFASARLFSNAVIYGPGLGADQPIGW